MPAGTEVKPRNVNYVYGGPDPEQVTALTNVTGGATYASFSYDAAGNMTAKCANGALASCSGTGRERFDYVYDGKDQLRRVTRRLANLATGTEDYWYDGNGARVAIVKKDASGVKTEMVWFIGETQAHYNATGTVTHAYSHVSLGTPVARVDRTADTTTSVEYQFHGLASSTLATVGSSGTINASFRYTPWGDALESTNAGGTANGAAAHRRRHNDQYVDELSNIVYYGARYYDKTTLTWTQSDPLYRFVPDAVSGKPRTALLYTFSLNGPLRYVDPDGRNPAAATTAGAEVGASLGGPVGAVIGGLIGLAAYGLVGDKVVEGLKAVSSVTTDVDHSDNYAEGSLYDLFKGEESWAPIDTSELRGSAESYGSTQEIAFDEAPVGGPVEKPAPNEAAKTKGPKKDIHAGTHGGERAGKAMTPAGKQKVKDANREKYGGRMKCEHCKKQVRNSKQSKRGVKTPTDSAQVDHIHPKAKNGDGSPCNGQVLCAPCNNCKSDKK